MAQVLEVQALHMEVVDIAEKVLLGLSEIVAMEVSGSCGPVMNVLILPLELQMNKIVTSTF